MKTKNHTKSSVIFGVMDIFNAFVLTSVRVVKYELHIYKKSYPFG